ncbi:hypothetical protein [Methylocystis sp. SB2]|uniref:hypothetical protein n=1 Tax=Methylocystis sp. (strain SB2) TaxID=743836 RepID=UPI0004039C66|nr:hypothetical protein [Methylocystis sp. SB2]ULO24169.1 hypothetical protein LNB28_01790 [Methylocystis sp. SB2]
MRRSIALLSFILIAGAVNARAENLPSPPPLDVSGWYLRGNVDAPEQLTEGQSQLPPNLLVDLANGPARPTHYSMSELR